MSKGGGVSNGINFASSDRDIYPTLRLGARGAAFWGGEGGDNTPLGPGVRPTFELAKFIPSTVWMGSKVPQHVQRPNYCSGIFAQARSERFKQFCTVSRSSKVF